MDQREVFLYRNLPFGRMDETPFVDISVLVALVYLRQGWQVEVLVVKSNDTKVIHRCPLSFIDNAVGKGVKTSFSNVVPTQLWHTLRFFGLSVDIRFQQFIFLLFLEETEIALALNFFFEAFKFRHICLLQLYGALDAVLILQFKDTAGLVIVGNEEQRTDDEIRPCSFTPLWVKVIIMIALSVKAIAFKLIGLLDGLSTFLLLPSSGGIRQGAFPDGSLAVFVLQVCQQRGLQHF